MWLHRWLSKLASHCICPRYPQDTAVSAWLFVSTSLGFRFLLAWYYNLPQWSCERFVAGGGRYPCATHDCRCLLSLTFVSYVSVGAWNVHHHQPQTDSHKLFFHVVRTDKWQSMHNIYHICALASFGKLPLKQHASMRFSYVICASRITRFDSFTAGTGFPVAVTRTTSHYASVCWCLLFPTVSGSCLWVYSAMFCLWSLWFSNPADLGRSLAAHALGGAGSSDIYIGIFDRIWMQGQVWKLLKDWEQSPHFLIVISEACKDIQPEIPQVVLVGHLGFNLEPFCYLLNFQRTLNPFRKATLRFKEGTW